MHGYNITFPDAYSIFFEKLYPTVLERPHVTVKHWQKSGFWIKSQVNSSSRESPPRNSAKKSGVVNAKTFTRKSMG